jgi:hypothetical protein
MKLRRRRKPDPEAMEALRRARAEAFQARTEGARVRLRGAALETRRRLRPVGRPFASLLGGVLGRIAPVVTGALLFVIRLFAALLAGILEVSQVVLGRIGRAAAATGTFLSIHVQRLGTLAVVAAVAAVALGVSQFFDYQAVVAGEPDYSGEVGTVAPPPVTHEEAAGDAHLYLLLPVAAGALALIWLTYRGNWRLGRWIAALGLLGIVVSLAIDLPQGLDAGTDSVAFSGSDAELIEGFWAQLFASAALVLCGLALGGEVRRRAGREDAPEPSEPRSRRALWKRRPRTAADGGGIAAGGGAGS